MTRVAYCSAKQFAKLTPCPDTVAVSLQGDTFDLKEVPGTGWKHKLEVRMLVPDVVNGEFAPKIDDPAKKLGKELAPYLKDVKNVVIHCEHGEIRSVAVGYGVIFNLAVLGEDAKFGTMQAGEFKEFEPGMDRYCARFAGVLQDSLEEHTTNEGGGDDPL